MRPLPSCLVAASALIVAGCFPPARSEGRSPAGTAPWFQDVAADAGIDFRLGHGGRSPLTVLETASGGCGFLDYNQDGRPDILLAGDGQCKLYRGTASGRFEPGPRLPQKRWMGCAVGDYDGDGYPDILLTGYRCLALLRNLQGQGFVDVTARVGLRTDLWSTSAEFADLDRDGYLDLYVGAYLDYRIGTLDLCRVGPIRMACGPEVYLPERGRAYRNVGGRRFTDVTERLGLARASGKTWGVAFGDYDLDGWPDLYLANDRVPGNLFHNERGRFREVGLVSGTAYDRSGNALGAMGADWGDADGDGKPDLFVTTYFGEANALFRGDGRGQFREESDPAGLAAASRTRVGFGCAFLDVDNDGDLDVITANGHVRDRISDYDASQSYAQPLQLWLNDGRGAYREASRDAGLDRIPPAVGRGLAVADYDADGDVDVLLVDLEGRARLLRNDLGSLRGRGVEFRLRGRTANREALGARVTLFSSSGRQVRWVKRGGSVLSSSEPVAHFGLGAASAWQRVEVRWPDGTTEAWLGRTEAGEFTVTQGSSAEKSGQN